MSPFVSVGKICEYTAIHYGRFCLQRSLQYNTKYLFARSKKYNIALLLTRKKNDEDEVFKFLTFP